MLRKKGKEWARWEIGDGTGVLKGHNTQQSGYMGQHFSN